MDNKPQLTEIINPKQTLKRRERDAGLEPGGLMPKEDAGKSQRDFLYPPGYKPRDKNPEGLKKLLEKRKAEERASNDEFEDEFRKGTDDPLTDSVRASRKMAGADRMRDVAEYENAYNA